MSRRSEQIQAAKAEGSKAKNNIKSDQSKGKQPTRPDLESRGQAATREADLKAAAKAAGEPGYRK